MLAPAKPRTLQYSPVNRPLKPHSLCCLGRLRSARPAKQSPWSNCFVHRYLDFSVVATGRGVVSLSKWYQIPALALSQFIQIPDLMVTLNQPTTHWEIGPTTSQTLAVISSGYGSKLCSPPDVQFKNDKKMTILRWSTLWIDVFWFVCTKNWFALLNLQQQQPHRKSWCSHCSSWVNHPSSSVWLCHFGAGRWASHWKLKLEQLIGGFKPVEKYYIVHV